MIDYTDKATAQQRLSHVERDEAVSALSQFASEGRLTDAEATQRSETARSAVTRGDLAPLFSDLPVAAGAQAAAPQPQAAAFDGSHEPPYGQSGYAPGGSGYSSQRSQRSWRYAAVSLTPFVALALFFISGNLWGFSFAWLWFLLVPIAGIIVYGIGGWSDHDRDRYRDR